MKNALQLSRTLVILAAIFLLLALFLPIWQIQLSAPQYPEGLVLKIYAKGLAGDVEIVNGLNHYIGMRALHSHDFIEFTLLPYILGTLVVLGLLVAFINKKSVYYAYIALFMFVAIVSMVDFYRWEYNYGHNLDPEAPIQVPGMTYTPPLLGYKQLLNFGAFSIPDSGGWLFVAAGVVLAIAYFILLQPKWLPFTRKKTTALAVLFLPLFMQSCSSQPQPINYGKDACTFCKMTIMQKGFAAEWVTNKGKVYRFDDLHCLLSFRKTDNSKGEAYINDFTGKKELAKAADLFFVESKEVNAPMGGHFAAFSNKADAENMAKTKGTEVLTWQQVESEPLK